MFHSFVHTHTYSLSLSHARTHLLVCVNCAYFASIFVYFSMHIQFFFFICLDIHFFASIGTYFFHLLLLLLPLTTRVNTRTLTETPIKKITNKTTTEKNLLVFLSVLLLRMFSLAVFFFSTRLWWVCVCCWFFISLTVFTYKLHSNLQRRTQLVSTTRRDKSGYETRASERRKKIVVCVCVVYNNNRHIQTEQHS